MDQEERHCFFITTLLIHIPFLPSFLGGKRKGEKHNQSCGQQNAFLLNLISGVIDNSL